MGLKAPNDAPAAAHAAGPPAVDALTSLRGLAALWVVVHHFREDMVRLFPSLVAADPLSEFGHLAVPFFFVLSGYVLAYNYAAGFRQVTLGRFLSFVTRRFARIYPVHFAALMLLLVFALASARLGFPINRQDKFTAFDFFLNLFLVQTWVPDFQLNWNGPAWSISSEWFAYLLFPFLCLGLNRLRGPRPFGVLAVAGWAASVALYTREGHVPFRELLAVIPTFFTGCCLCLLVARTTAKLSIPRFLPDAIVLAIVVTPFAIAAMSGWSERTRYEVVVALEITYFAAAIGCFGYLGDSCSRIWRSRPLLYLGEISYSLYMTHSLAMIGIAKLLPATRFADAGFGARFGAALAYGVIVAVAALAMYYVVEEPARKWLRNLHANPTGKSGQKT